MISATRKVRFVRRPDKSRAIVAASATPRVVEPGRVPRISRLMSLAIHFDRLIREGKVANLSELARLAHVTQPRMTQIMNLNHLAPNIQEQLLFLPKTVIGREHLHERTLRPLTGEFAWKKQRQLLRRICGENTAAG